jgi:hypothetical protein
MESVRMNQHTDSETEELPRKTIAGNDDPGPFYNDLLSYDPPLKSHRWAVPWSDLMMTMFIFFAVLYIYQTADRELLFGRGPGKNTLSEPAPAG